jgi:signal transduction histidine kinase
MNLVMTTAPSHPPAPASDSNAALFEGSATAVTLARMRKHFWPTLAVMVLMCVAIALFLNGFVWPRLGPKLVYSFAIGFSCWAANSAGRLLVAWWVDRRRRAQGLPAVVPYAAPGWQGVLMGLVLGLVIGPALGLEIGDALTGGTSPSLLKLDTQNSRITLIITLVGSLVATYVFGSMERLASAHARAEAAQRQAAENQLRLLQSQLEPHMLFNTLANLRVLIGLDANRAQAMLDHLIAFLRSTLLASRQSQQPLSTEFAHASDYLALMAVRMGPRLQVSFDLPADLASLPVPPLLLQPLVENAIKHGLEPKLEGGHISVHAQRVGDMLQLTVRDSGMGLQPPTPHPSPSPSPSASGAPAAGTSFGLEQVRARLATLYGGRASLVLQAATDNAGGVVAKVQIPLTDLQAQKTT